MGNKIKIGSFKTEKRKVLESESALNMGSGDLNVYSTPSMVSFMEFTSKNLINNFLNKEIETSVGVSLSIKHVKAIKIGEEIKCTAKIVGIEKNRIDFNIKVLTKDEALIGSGTHSRFIVNKERFISSIK